VTKGCETKITVARKLLKQLGQQRQASLSASLHHILLPAFHLHLFRSRILIIFPSSRLSTEVKENLWQLNRSS